MSGFARALSPEEREAFRLARLVAAETVPYYMHALFAVQPLAAPGLETFAVDAAWRLYMDPERLIGPTAWPVPTAGAVLVHEVEHLIRDHAGRAAALAPPLHHLAWNLAADAEINDGLLAAAVPLPDGVVTPASLGCGDGDVAEVYYAAIRPPSSVGPLPDDGGVGCGSGAGSPGVPGELSADVVLGTGDGSALSDAAGELVRRRVARDVMDHAQGKGRGTVPAGVARWAAATLAPPVIRWDKVLRATVRRAVADRAGRTDYTYARPPRRRRPGIVTPAMRTPSVRVSIVVDTSGSMSQADLDAAMAEVGGVLRASGVARDGIRLLSCDAAATTSVRVRSSRTVALTGGGGTDMRIGIRAAEQDAPAPHVVIVLTDGDTPWPDRPTRSRLICAVISASPPTRIPAWAALVHIPCTN